MKKEKPIKTISIAKAKLDKNFNCKTKDGYLMHIANNDPYKQGILSKLVGRRQFFFIEGKWIEV